MFLYMLLVCISLRLLIILLNYFIVLTCFSEIEPVNYTDTVINSITPPSVQR